MVDWISANWSDVIELYNNFYGLIIHEKTTMWEREKAFVVMVVDDMVKENMRGRHLIKL